MRDIINSILHNILSESQEKDIIEDQIVIKNEKEIYLKNNEFGVSKTTSRTHYYKIPPIDTKLREKIERLKAAIAVLEKNFCKKQSDFVDNGYKIKYAKELNPQQLEAAITISGKILVIAGAGTGKTRTLAYRTAYLLENNISAEKILILTFTKKAAGVIKQRVSQLLGNNLSNNVTSGTFHSFCNMLLMRYSKVLGINPKFTILDQEDSRDLIELLKKRIVEKNTKASLKKETIQNIISLSRNLMISIEKVIERYHPEVKNYQSAIDEIFNSYMSYKKNNNLYDYDDLIDNICDHLINNDNFKEIVTRQYQHVMVDEYQDTNVLQKKLIDLLAGKNGGSLMVVGDDNQSIYAFRGANYENILLFGESYPSAKLIKLEQNYRSTANILDFINAVSENILLGYKKILFNNETRKGRVPTFIRCIDNEQEARIIADYVIKSKERIDYNKIAILCRSSFHSNFIQAEFLKRHIPFIVIGGLKFIEKRHIKDIIAYFKILHNPFDYISWNRILTILNGIGNKTADKIIQKILDRNGELTPLDELKDKEDIRLLYDMLNLASNSKSLLEMFEIVREYYVPILKKLEEDWEKRLEDFKVLERLCAEYRTLEALLSNVALDPPNKSKAEFISENDDNEDAVTISTIHSAKGLEWNTVFVISMLDGAIPSYKAFNDYEQLEEERKLFYVACSRAKENLYLTSPTYLLTYGSYFDKLSRFLIEIDQNKYNIEEYYDE